ncbi:efflux RND transporter permease subunit [Halostella litorea]|uniref:efflux RND transporter permease subunit n=1 Tax=Halostella litorea TaxID=2528831 RepID=UPI0010925A48|nr:MMPL family transporter [Halostella litorea]
MLRTFIDDCIDAVTTHSWLVVFLMLLLTAGMAVGATDLNTGSNASGNDMLPSTTPDEKAEYVQQQYGAADGSDGTVRAAVYVRAADGNALSKAALLDALRYQRTVTRNESVAAATPDGRSVAGVPNAVARRLANDSDADLDAQIAALEAASPEEVNATVRGTLTRDSELLRLLPNGYEPGTATAESHRMLFPLAATEGGEPPSDATRALFAAADDREDPEYFTLGEHAMARNSERLNQNTVAFVLPIALTLIVGVLAFTYRDPVDVVVGLTGVVVSVVWMFGILGWLGVSAGVTMIVGPVLIAGLSIDYGFHVFTRYREQCGPDEGVRPPMRRAVRSVAFALGLVTLTTGIGFLSNLVNPVPDIRALGVGITLGVLSALVVFLTLVPALKVGVDDLLERAGLDRRKRPLGESALLRPLLRSSVALAKRAAPVVVAVALVAGSAGAVAWTALDEQPFDRQTEPAAEWKTELPGPMAWEDGEYGMNDLYVQERYRAVADEETDRVQLLVEGDVTDDAALASVRRGAEATAADARTPGARVVSPLSVMRSVTDRNDAFAKTFAAADTDGDGVPDRNLEAVYDHLYAVAPDAASRVIERTDGEYRSLRVVGPADGGGTLDERATAQRDAAAAVEAGDADLTATAVSRSTIRRAGIAAITDGVLRVMALALAAVLLTLVAVSWRVHGSASLGVVAGVPVTLVAGLVIGGMYVLDVPLTLLTALLMSLVVGLGIDYNIHVADRFAAELRRGRDAFAALETAVVGTGGALLGSALTTAVAFVSLLLHPSPQLRNFGTLVVLALLAALVVSVVVLPSMLALWARAGRAEAVREPSEAPAAPATDD